MGVKFKVAGLRELERALRRTEKRVEKATESVMRQAAKVIMRESVATVNIDTGALQASGMWFQEGTGYNAVITVGHGFPVAGFYDDRGREKVPAEYAVYHHEGVNPWFEGSVYTVAPTIHLLVTQRISKALGGIMTPAEVFQEAIKSRCEELGYKVFIHHMPDKPDNAVSVHDTQFGRLEERRMRTGEVDTFPVVRVVVRGLDHTASGVLPDLWEVVLRDLHSLPVGSSKILKQTTPNNTMVSVGHEPQTRRTLFSQQFRMCIE